MRRTVLLIPVLVLLLSAPAAKADTLAYTKGGNVWLAAGDGSGARRLTAGGGWEYPTQSANGTLWAVRKVTETRDGVTRHPRRVYRLRRRDGKVEKVLEPLPVDNSFYAGPYGLRVAPDGKTLAFFWFYDGPILSDGFKVSYTYTDRPTENGRLADIGEYLNPTWLGSDRVAVFNGPDYTDDVQIDDVNSRTDTVQTWIRDDGAALGGGDATADFKRFAATADGASAIRIYDLDGGRPPSGFAPRCQITQPAGQFYAPVWSPSGAKLAWGENDGIHVGMIPGNCNATQKLLIKGGQWPDWSAAPLPKLAFGLTAPKALKRAAVLAGPRLKVRCRSACRLTATLRVHGKLAARGRATRKSAGVATVRPKPVKGGRARLATAKKVTLALSARGYTTLKKTIRVR